MAEKTIFKDLSVFECAIRGGRLEIFEFLLERYKIDEKSVMDLYLLLNDFLSLASRYGRMELIEYLLGRFTTVQWDFYLPLERSPHSGNLEIMKLFIDKLGENIQGQCGNTYNEAVADEEYLLNASETRNIDALFKLLVKLECKCDSFDLIERAASVGSFELIKWIHSNTTFTNNLTYQAMDIAATYGHREILLWLHTNTTVGCSKAALDKASIKGRLDIVKWLKENRTEGYTPGVINLVAANGKLEVVEWYLSNTNERFSVDILEKVIPGGHLNMVKYLHERNGDDNLYRFSSNSMDLAAKYDQLDIIKWLSENRTEGCTINALLFTICGSDRVDILQWLTENRKFILNKTSLNKTAMSLEELLYIKDDMTRQCPSSFESLSVLTTSDKYNKY
ncbi:hypothetical protein PPL_11731 [Heterostelium album PN500]|uniref:Ankyrin repeat protein n=1 Tax=Heterostelium pallidum (strain ATCC 26659 / Pp 5 / PN500) TaxID=670386 RepID=D3BUB2_HETP5|nr:hypothetical protein PPL_11731 [Heterostelium album PN500]EFA75046.1 hypothetical protein PPL_11731 [Heterostelium album PN500]|eukprot:XP_020427180.1 hypothetical protein PPL_11731 [Heterostelium album PN500]